ncbi:MAG: helix-turn-helix domain-containing protein [Cytophagaceae bacterium]
MQRNRKLLLLLFSGSVVLAGLLSYFLRFDKIELFPDKSDRVKFATYHEGYDQDYSFSEAKLNNDESISFRYRLTQKLQEPFTALFFYKNSIEKLFDLSAYNSITLNIKSEKAKRIPVTFTLDYEGLTTYKNDLSNLPFTKVIDYTGEGEYSISFTEFEIPSWWLRHHQIKKEELTKIDFRRVNYVVIGSCQVLEAGVNDEIIVKSVSFSYNNSNEIKIFVFLSLLFYGSCFLWYFYFKRKVVLIPYVPKDTSLEKKTSKIDLITGFISVNYSNPDLSLEEMQKAVGVSSREISNLLKQHYNSSFKSYLNTIRLTEVKRLLKETTKPVSEIAYEAGYNNISHFNRVFKTETGMSPKEYREG